MANGASHPPTDGGAHEARRMLRPAMVALMAMVRFVHWPILLLFVAYLCSGITQVRPGEVAIQLRFGKLVGENAALAVHQPGLLLALPRPIDEIVRVNVMKVHEVALFDLTTEPGAVLEPRDLPPFDPERDGYCLTGDNNIVLMKAVARYQIRDPVAHALNQVEPEALLRDAVYASLVRSAGEIGVEIVFTEQRFTMSRMARQRAQARLDEVESGLDLVSLELIEIIPPFQVYSAFQDFLEATIERTTKENEAYTYRAQEIPKARGAARRLVTRAGEFYADTTARAAASARVFEAVHREYLVSPDAVRERLYRTYLLRAIDGVGTLRMVPPPAGERYEGFRITIPAE